MTVAKVVNGQLEAELAQAFEVADLHRRVFKGGFNKPAQQVDQSRRTPD
nr:hypothetical protein [Sulfurivirga caldicuralii]